MKAVKDIPEQLLDLPKAITDLLIKKGHPNPTAWLSKLNPDAFKEDINYSRFLINRYFRSVLGAVETECTMNTRFCLVDECTIPQWYNVFVEGVVGTIVRLGL
jgi:L-lysine 2,3-aminomutase